MIVTGITAITDPAIRPPQSIVFAPLNNMIAGVSVLYLSVEIKM